MSEFIVGINLPCIDNQYDHDIGSNEVRGIEYGDQPLQSTFKDTKKHFEKYLETISALGVKVVRLWLFERFEGLQFNSDGSVFGISKDMVYNLKDACKIAQKYNVKFYFCLMDTWGVLADDLKNSPKGDPRVKYAAILNGLITTPSKRQSFLNLVANLLVKDDDIKNSVWAVDVLNEPDGIERTQTMESSIQGKIDTGITWDHLYDYINDACDTIKNKTGHKVSCGIRSEYLQQFFPHVKAKVDFFDIHKYHNDGILESPNHLGKPCIIGECGQGDFEERNDLKQKTAIENFLKNAEKLGYRACFVWEYGLIGENKPFSLINDDGTHRPVIDVIKKYTNKNLNSTDF